MSGARDDRPQFQAMIDFARPGDTIVVWRLDRLGRSLKHLIETVMGLQARGINFRSLTEHVDTSTPGGKFTFHLFGALAEMERDVIRQRTKAGLEATRARGRIGGRPALQASCQKTPAGQGTLREEKNERCRGYGADRLSQPLQLL